MIPPDSFLILDANAISSGTDDNRVFAKNVGLPRAPMIVDELRCCGGKRGISVQINPHATAVVADGCQAGGNVNANVSVPLHRKVVPVVRGAAGDANVGAIAPVGGIRRVVL